MGDSDCGKANMMVKLEKDLNADSDSEIWGNFQ